MANKLDLETADRSVIEYACSVHYVAVAENFNVSRLFIELDTSGTDRYFGGLNQMFFMNLLPVENTYCDDLLVVIIDPENESPLYTEAVRRLLGESLQSRVRDRIRGWCRTLSTSEDIYSLDVSDEAIVSREEAQAILDRLVLDL